MNLLTENINRVPIFFFFFYNLNAVFVPIFLLSKSLKFVLFVLSIKVKG